MKSFLFASALAVAASGAQAAPVAIDTFNTTNFQVVGAPTLGNNPVNPATVSGPTVDAIGGIRTITNTRTDPAGTADAFGRQVQSVVTGGVASVSLGAGTSGFSVFSYGAGGADLTDGGLNDTIELTVIETDLGVLFTLNFDGTTVSKGAAGAGKLSFGFAAFSSVDFTNIDSISLTIEGPEAFDTVFDQIEAVRAADTEQPVTPVPLPAGLPLLLGALGILAVRNRRRA